MATSPTVENEARETLLPRPVLFNAALYSAIALVYSVSFFIIDRVGPDKYVFERASSLRTTFSYVAICSWAVLLFGGLILVAVRVGANVRRRRRRRSRRRKSRARRLDSERRREKAADNNDTDQGMHRSRSRPESAGSAAAASRASADPGGVPPSPSLSLSASIAPSSSLSRTATPSPDAKRGAGAEKAKSRGKKKKKGKDGSSHSSRAVPVGFVSVTPAQKVYAGVGFAWVAVGLAATAAAAGLVFFGQRERLKHAISTLGLESDSDERWREWVIPICTGGIFMVLFALLALTTLSKVFLILLTKPRDPDPVHGPEAGMLAAGDSALDEDGEGGGTLFERDAVTGHEFDPDFDVEQGLGSRGALEQEVYGMMSEGVPSSSSGTWRQYTSERQLPFQPDDATIDRMMRQLRDMGFSNPHQNIAALQASSFDLEKASDKLANTRVE